MQQILIVGLGLIGSSMGLALRQWQQADLTERAIRVIGFDSNHEQQLKAKQIKAVDDTAWDLLPAAREADVVILCVPVRATRDVFEAMAPNLKEGAVVTDTSSTKKQVMEWAKELLPAHVAFVGGHPMAGGLSGVDEPSADLFKNCTYCVVSTSQTTDAAVRLINGLIIAIGAQAYYLDADEHDSYVAAISHLPLLSSAALVSTATFSPSWRDMRRLASTGFRDATRLASGDPVMGRDIALTNREFISYWLGEHISKLQALKEMLESSEDVEAPVETFLMQAKSERDKWLRDWKSGNFEERESTFEVPTVSDTMGRMFLGALRPKKKK